MAPQQLLLERDTAMLEADAQLGAALGKFRVELAFKGADFLDERGDLRRHGIAPSSSGSNGNPCITLPADAHWAGSAVPTGEFMGILLEINLRDRLSGHVRSRRFPPFWL